MTMTRNLPSDADLASLSLPDEDAELMNLAASLEQQLENAARASGFLSYADMSRSLHADAKRLDKTHRDAVMKNLAPIQEEMNQHANSRKLPAVDAAGLVAIADLARSVARLIRILLVGYTEEEVEELRGRISAERAVEVGSTTSLKRTTDRHDTAIERLNELSDVKLHKAAP